MEIGGAGRLRISDVKQENSQRQIKMGFVFVYWRVGIGVTHNTPWWVWGEVKEEEAGLASSSFVSLCTYQLLESGWVVEQHGGKRKKDNKKGSINESAHRTSVKMGVGIQSDTRLKMRCQRKTCCHHKKLKTKEIKTLHHKSSSKTERFNEIRNTGGNQEDFCLWLLFFVLVAPPPLPKNVEGNPLQQGTPTGDSLSAPHLAEKNNLR